MLLVVNVASVSEPDDDDQQDVVLNGVEEAVVADSNSKTWSALYCARTGRARIFGKQSNRASDASTDRGVELAQGTDGTWAELDPISAHAQPRSALTCSQGMFGPSSAIAWSKAAASSASSNACISCS